MNVCHTKCFHLDRINQSMGYFLLSTVIRKQPQVIEGETGSYLRKKLLAPGKRNGSGQERKFRVLFHMSYCLGINIFVMEALSSVFFGFREEPDRLEQLATRTAQCKHSRGNEFVLPLFKHYCYTHTNFQKPDFRGPQ